MAYAAIAKDFVKRGVPLHCIGFESHFIGGSTPSDIAESMKQFTDLGLEVPLTELDIRISVVNGTQTPTNATQVGKQSVKRQTSRRSLLIDTTTGLRTTSTQ